MTEIETTRVGPDAPIQAIGNDEKMDDYRSLVAQEAEQETGRVILNRTPDHAAIVVSAIFKKAERIVEITCDGLDGPIWSNHEVTTSAVDFLSRNPDAKVRIVASQIPSKDNVFLAAMIANGVHERVQTSAWRGDVSSYPFHFVVADGRHHRFQRERSAFEAMIQFGDADLGQKLRRIFAGLREVSDEVNFT